MSSRFRAAAAAQDRGLRIQPVHASRLSVHTLQIQLQPADLGRRQRAEWSIDGLQLKVELTG